MKVITLTIEKDTTLTYLCWGVGLIEVVNQIIEKHGGFFFLEGDEC